jgi:hypothetical protein
MTGAVAPGSMQAHCSPEQMAAGLRRLNRAPEGHSGHRLRPQPSRQFPLAAGGVSSSGCGRGGQYRASLHAVTVPDASTDSAAQQPQWERLEALYTSDQFPVSAPSPWRLGLPSPAESSALQQLLRPVGGLLHLAVQLEESPQKLQQDQEERRKRQDYYANVGDAIRTLREETPLLFWRDLTCEQGVLCTRAGTNLVCSLHTLRSPSSFVITLLYGHTVCRRHLPGGCGVQGSTERRARQEELQAHLQGGCQLSSQVALL